MIADRNMREKTRLLHDQSMKYETSVTALPAKHYPEYFFVFYRVKN